MDVSPPSWHKTFPFASTRYAMNDDETVMAIATDDDSVTLLRASDSKVLDRRRLRSSSTGKECIRMLQKCVLNFRFYLLP